MRLDALFPRWRAASTNPQIPWDQDIDLADGSRFAGLLGLIAFDQSQSSMRRPDEFAPICRSIVEDILALRADPSPGSDPLDLLYLQFEACLVPLRSALNVGALGDTFDWIVNGLGDELAHGVERPLDLDRLDRFAASSTDWIVDNRSSTVADWAVAFFYLSRRSATLQEAGRALLPATLRILEPMGETDPQAIQARCMILNWAVVYAPGETAALAARLEATFGHPGVDPSTRTRIAVLFATNEAGLTERTPASWAAWAMADGGGSLASHEPFQLIWQRVSRVEDWDRLRPEALAAASDYALSLRRLGSPTAIAQATDQRSGLLGPAFVRMTEFGRSDDLLGILARWYDIPPAMALGAGALFVSPNHHAGTAFLGAGAQIFPAGLQSVAELTAITNEALGLTITVQGEVAQPVVPERAGQPDYALGKRFHAALTGAYRFEEIDPAVMAGRTSLIACPGQPHPVQALLAEARGTALPIASSLEVPAPDRAPRRALIWSADNDLYAGFEADAVQQRFEAARIACDRRSGIGARPEDFLKAFADPVFDIVWVSGHGEIDHWRHGSACIVAGEGCLVGIDELVLSTPRERSRRLLMLNICDGGGAAVNGGIHRLGLAPMLARRSQATISHLWPVRPLVAAAFGVLLADGIAREVGFFKAYEEALQAIRAPSGQVTAAVARLIPGAGLIERLEATDLETDNIFHWGSAAFFE